MNPEASRQTVLRPSEEELLAALRKLLSADAPGVLVGVGDDAAVVEPGRHPSVLTTDLLVEDVHFRRNLGSAHDLGYKAIVVNVSDIAAMAASPRYALVALALPSADDVSFLMELYGGMLQAAEEHGLSIVGGDLSRAPAVTVAVTVVGEVAAGRALTRSGARVEDRIVVTGALGGAAGGLRLVEGTSAEVHATLGTEWARELAHAFSRPTARVAEAHTLAQAGATAMIDISDGLAIDLARLCRESGVGARIRADALPVHPALGDLERALGARALDLALHGGEDYELLATLPPGAVEGALAQLGERFGTSLADIGEVTTEGLQLVAPDGSTAPLEAKGWDHFGG